MLYLHFCQPCNRIHVLSGHRTQCPACSSFLYELSIPYHKYIYYDVPRRTRLLKKCSNAEFLKKHHVIYPSCRTLKK